MSIPKRTTILSFVVPAYNEEARIAGCIESIQREIVRMNLQGATELVVVNNASTDRTKEIALTYPDVIVVDEPKKGLTRARQAGFLSSSGILIANIDADTLMPRGWLSVVIDEFCRDPGLVALSGPFIMHDLPPLQAAAVDIFFSMYLPAHIFLHHVLGLSAILQGGNFVLRRRALQKIGGFNTAIEFYGEDVDIARRIAKLGRVKWTNKLPMYASGRRLANEGMGLVAIRYAINFFSITFGAGPVTKEYADIRTESVPRNPKLIDQGNSVKSLGSDKLSRI